MASPNAQVLPIFCQIRQIHFVDTAFVEKLISECDFFPAMKRARCYHTRIDRKE